MDLFSGILHFVHTAQQRSFRGAAERLGISAAAVSKAVAKLEEDLGVRLLARTSRHVSLTPEGELFLARCREAVSQVELARELVTQSQREPKGRLRLSVPIIVGRYLTGALARFTARYPAVTVHASYSDRPVALAEENVDVAVRIGDLDDSSMVSRRLCTTRWVTVATPQYLARRPPPRTPDDLPAHDCLLYLMPRGTPRHWPFADPDGQTRVVKVRGPLVVDHGEMLLEAALASMGICQVLPFMVHDLLAEGRLVEVLREHAAPGPPISALALAGRRTPRVRAFLDLLHETFAAPPWHVEGT
jgi:LysR family transcriptional regulator, regulator for bpeEF and oprC